MTYIKNVCDPLISCLKDSNVGVKLVVERALMHILKIGDTSKDTKDVLEIYTSLASKDNSEYLASYVRRILQKQTLDSEDESE